MSELESCFRNLAESALRCGTIMATSLEPAQMASVDYALRRGARLVLEFGPIPEFEAVRLVLVEREGARSIISTLQPRPGPAGP
ncbi:MAG: hypothetical protein IV093_03540 [Rubrivivax sp.]|nr:hypothetical protein [Rubrivivax sp.]